MAEGLKFQQAPVTISLAHGKRKAPPAAAGFESSLCDLLYSKPTPISTPVMVALPVTVVLTNVLVNSES